MKLSLLTIFAVLVIAGPTFAQQPPAPAPEHGVLKQDAGVWDAKVKMFVGPGEPQESKATETNRMVGDFWLVSSFKGEMMGMPFHGQGTFGYNLQEKQYEGTWVDSFSPNAMQMTGSYNKASKTMTYLGTGVEPDGSPMKSKLVTTSNDDGTRVMTMYAPNPAGNNEMMKVMEVTYTKRKRNRKPKK